MDLTQLNFADPVIRKLAQYPVNSMVQVYYNPDQPVQAILERTSRQAKTLWIATASLIFLIIVLGGMALPLGAI